MSEIRINKSTSTTFYGIVRLSDLRAFVLACANCKDNATVQIDVYRGDGRSGPTTKVTVNDA
jgi:hypothetical protein